MKETSSSKWLLTCGCFFSFFAFGFIDNLKGPILPELLHAENLSMSQGGTILLSAYVGFVVATLMTGIFSDNIGNRRVLFLAALCLLIGLFGVSQHESFWYLVVLMGCVGVGLGAIEVGANGLILELHPSNPGRFLNLLATFHGTGSFLVPLYVAWLVHWGLAWQTIFLSTAVLALAMVVPFTLASRVNTTSMGRIGVPARPSFRDILITGFQKPMGWYYLLISTYVAVELGLAAWLMEYLQRERSQTVSQSSFYLSAFFVMIMLGRFMGSMVVERIGYHRAVTMALFGGGLCTLGGLVLPNPMLILFSLSGAFFSIVFPTVTATATRHNQSNLGSLLGILFTFGGLGGAIGPWLIGIASQHFGLPTGMLLILGFCCIALMTSVFLQFLPSPKVSCS